ncbi:hypothetical protein [Alicyclobacillus dauci]|uniref:Uncharacterized protein n=1 Tax=Alicyclobacillus dauci TaxID=1475485 RepID=A0ABY6Z0R4_9BACL|nr:hypothetical protein [Alicyclobacillus dauci]WAH36454.1 hypothetical protein NZD86_19895 [Alicyclobacillus dauci]
MSDTIRFSANDHDYTIHTRVPKGSTNGFCMEFQVEAGTERYRPFWPVLYPSQSRTRLGINSIDGSPRLSAKHRNSLTSKWSACIHNRDRVKVTE